MSAGCGGDGDDRGAPRRPPSVVETSAPGSATLEFGGQKATTTIKRVSFRQQADPGQQFTKAGKGLVFVVFDVEVRSGGKFDAVGGGYSLKLPGGRTLQYTGVADGEKAIPFEPIQPGQTRKGTLSWEVPKPTKGQKFVLLWRP
ncbi:MAG: hypothetical protein ACRDIA_04790, partial [Actinomycetota bacterium]